MSAAVAAPPIARVSVDQFLGAPRKTAHYRPQVQGGDWYSAAVDGHPLFNLREAERMRRDPQVEFGLRILRAPLYQLQTAVEADSPRLGRFVREQFRAIWDGHLRQILNSMLVFGPAVGEVTHRASRGLVVFDRYDDVHPRDARPLVIEGGKRHGSWAGVRLKNGHGIAGADGGDGGWGDKSDIVPPHAFWCPGEAEYGSFWGRPRAAGAYEPWLEKRGKGGAVDSRRLWFKKCAFRGGMIRHPMGRSEYVLADGTTGEIDNEDLARQIVEKYENGGVLTLPNARNDKGDGYLWEWEAPGSNGEVGGVREYPQDLDKEILIGLGVVPEVIQAAEGSGLSQGGRSIPMQVFFASEDELAHAVVPLIDRQAIRPMVAVNFGVGAVRRYRLVPQSLAALVAKEPAQAGKMLQEPDPRQAVGGGLTGREPVAGKPPVPSGDAVRLSIDARKKLLRRIKRYERELRLSLDRPLPLRLSQDAGRWITIGGTKGADGKRHGGSPVFIKDGKIVKGHPSLTGKKIGALKEEADTSHRQELRSSKGHEVASLRKKARKAGHDPKALDARAAELKAHHDAFAGERKEVLQHARQHHRGNGFGELSNLASRAASGKLDADALRGFDQTAESTASADPHHFHEETGEHGSHEDQLFVMLSAGDPEPMSHADAYAQALEHMENERHHHADDSFGFGANADDPFGEEPQDQARAPVADRRKAAPGGKGKQKAHAAYGTAGPDHPLAGMDRKAQVKRLADARPGIGDEPGDHLGIDEAGPPDGLDMAKFGADAAAWADQHFAEKSYGADMPEAYRAIGEPFGLSKYDFLRAITAAHNAGDIRLSGWSKTTDEIPDPELVTQVSDKLFYYVQPGDTRKAAAPDPFRLSFSEAEHPRGQPDNAGQFVSQNGSRDRHTAPESPARNDPTRPAAVLPKGKKGKAPAVDADELHDLSALTPAADRPAWEKVVHVYAAVRETVFARLVQLGALVNDLTPVLADTADDYMSLKASVYGDQDAFKQATGISWAFTSTLVKHAIGVGFKLAGHEPKGGAVRLSLDDGCLDAGVELLADVLKAAHEAIGVDVPIDATALRELLAKRMGGEKADDGDKDRRGAAIVETVEPGEPTRLSWSETDHPRGDDGRFVAAEDLVAAKADSAKADELRQRVTHPAERKKLEAALGNAPHRDTYREHLEGAKEARRGAHAAAAGKAKEAQESAGRAYDAIQNANGGMAWDLENEEHDPYRELDELVAYYNPDGTLAERSEALKDIVTAAKQAVAVTDGFEDEDAAGFTAKDLESNHKRLTEIIAHARAARDQLRAYAKARREMAAVRSGEWMGGGKEEGPTHARG